MESDKNGNDNSCVLPPRAHIGVTPQMIRAAVKKLQLRKCYVDTELISSYLRSCYPVDKDVKTFREELNKKLDCAVRVGLIKKYRENSYYLPTLRQQANSLKTSVTAFWEIYRNVIENSYNKSGTSKNQNGKQCSFNRKK